MFLLPTLSLSLSLSFIFIIFVFVFVFVITGFKLEESGIVASHRLLRRRAESNREPRPVIINFTSRIKRTNFIVDCREKKFKTDIFGGITLTQNLFINEHLTPLTAEIFWLAHKLKLKGYQVETHYRALFIQVKDERRLKITSKSQIAERCIFFFMNQFLITEPEPMNVFFVKDQSMFSEKLIFFPILTI